MFNDFCEKEGIIDEVTLPYSPKSNGVAERTLKEMMNAIHVSSSTPNNLYGEALLIACLLSLYKQIPGWPAVAMWCSRFPPKNVNINLW